MIKYCCDLECLKRVYLNSSTESNLNKDCIFNSLDAEVKGTFCQVLDEFEKQKETFELSVLNAVLARMCFCKWWFAAYTHFVSKFKKIEHDF